MTLSVCISHVTLLPYVLYFFGLLSNGYSPFWIEGHLIHKKQQKDNKIVLTLFCLRVMLFNNSMYEMQTTRVKFHSCEFMLLETMIIL